MLLKGKRVERNDFNDGWILKGKLQCEFFAILKIQLLQILQKNYFTFHMYIEDEILKNCLQQKEVFKRFLRIFSIF